MPSDLTAMGEPTVKTPSYESGGSGVTRSVCSSAVLVGRAHAGGRRLPFLSRTRLGPRMGQRQGIAHRLAVEGDQHIARLGTRRGRGGSRPDAADRPRPS